MHNLNLPFPEFQSDGKPVAIEAERLEDGRLLVSLAVHDSPEEREAGTKETVEIWNGLLGADLLA